jgi:hypothetical protein
MSADLTKDTREDAVVAVPGILCVSPSQVGQAGQAGRKVVHLGPSAGWMIPRGLMRWEQEVSFVDRADMTPQLAKTLHATLPHEQIAAKRFSRVASAVEASPLLAISSNLVDAARKEGVRVHTVGVDRVSADFYYFAEGGSGGSLRAQGNLVEMLADRVSAGTTNAEIEALQVSLINRLLSSFSNGVVSELQVELAGALPRLSRDGTGLLGTDLEAFEAQAQALVRGSARFEVAARQLAEALTNATRKGQSHARVPLYGDAQRETMAPLEVQVMGKPLQLPECFVWTVTGVPRETGIESPAKPVAKPIETLAPAQPTSAAASAAAAQLEGASTKPIPASPATTVTEAAMPPVASSTRPKDEVATQPSAATAAPRSAQGGQRLAQAAPSRKHVHASPRRSPWVPMLLLLGLVTSLYFLWQSLH